MEPTSKDNQLVTNPFGEQVYMKPEIVNGQQIGITECCRYGEPCELHYWIVHKGLPLI